MGFIASFSNYKRQAFRWQRGRQGTGYDKMLLLTARWPLGFDSWLLPTRCRRAATTGSTSC